ncbi:MAG: S-(hydroxymethyl)glutathione dehydrogenase/alcohol dehydrogenase [Acidimicrobiales bacterium]
MTSTPIRAAVCRSFGEPLSVEQLHLAAPESGQVQVKILASAVCHSDIHFFDGAWGGRLPAVWGHEAAGVVEALGDGVSEIDVGDHVVITLIKSCGDCRNCRSGASVACTGELSDHPSPLSDADGNAVGHGLGTAAFAERAVVDQSQVVVIHSEMAMAPASLLACGIITGVGAAINTAKIEAGSSVVVIGTGGVGLNAVQGARLAGATTIIAVDLADEKLEAAREFGATEVINSRTHDLHQAVKTITEGTMVDYVLVTVGARQPIEQAPSLLAPNGTVVIVGMPATGVTVTIDPVMMAALNQSILGSKMGTSTINVDIPELISKYRDGDLLLDELVTHTCAIDDINEAIESVKSGHAIRNVILFDPDTIAAHQSTADASTGEALAEDND